MMKHKYKLIKESGNIQLGKGKSEAVQQQSCYTTNLEHD